MAFVNASLIFGSLLVAAPIILHLMMRRRPKQLVFPALRFVKERREQNQRRLRLRQLLLLALRCLAVVALAAALARPSVDSATVGDWLLTLVLALLFVIAAFAAVAAIAGGRGRLLAAGLTAAAVLLFLGTGFTAMSALRETSQLTIGDEEAPVAAAVVVDTSPRMTYRHENRTRLEQAKETALWLLPQLPPESEVAVLDARPGPAVFAVDRAAARKALERLETTTASRQVTDVIAEALTLVRRSDKNRKEIYIFSDLTAAAWRDADSARLREQLQAAPDVLIYVFDVGVETPQNTSLNTLRLSDERLTPGRQLEVSVDVARVGGAPPRAIELYLETPDPTLPVIRDGEMITPPALPRQRKAADRSSRLPERISTDQGSAASRRAAEADQALGGPALDGGARTEDAAGQGGPTRLRFAPLPKLPLGVHHGFVRLEGTDALPLDDVRFFTVEVRRPWPVLVVAPPSAEPSFFTEAVAPYEFRVTDQARFECQTIAQDALANTALDSFAAVCLLDPAPLSTGEWNKLADFARQGGGVAFFLGRNAQNYASFNEPAAQAVLPGKIAAPFIWNAPHGDLYFAPGGAEHPVLAPFRTLATVTPWSEFPVYKHWVMAATAPDSTVVARYGNNRAAILERSLGKGRVVTMTTPVSDPLHARGREPWNALPTGFDPWPFVILANELSLYLVGEEQSRLNYTTGETAELANHAQEHPVRYELFPPSGDPRETTAQEGTLVVRFLEAPGAYRLKGNRGGVVLRGFSVNLPPEATDLTRAAPERLDEALGEDRYQLARTREEFRRKIGLARQGREFYPLLLVVLAVVMGLESLLANRFYKGE